MPFFDFFRNLFGGRDSNESRNFRIFDPQSHPDNFRNPIWQIDDDESDIDDFRQPRGRMHFSIFTDPIEMMRYFEAQMDNIMKDFYHGLGDNNNLFSFPEIENPQMNTLPYAPPKQESLRDKFLKQGDNHDKYADDKVDIDLDGKITPSEFAKVWSNSSMEKPTNMQPYVQQDVFGKSMRTEVYQRSDGTVEHKKIIRDSDGNEETVISREIGDKKYVITTRKDKSGVVTKTEDLINMDENELKNFTEQWGSRKDSSVTSPSILGSFPWEKFFGPNPKL